MKLLWVIAVVLVAAVAGRKSYSGYQVIRTAPLDEDTARKLIPLMGRPELDFWSSLRVGAHVDVMVPPTHVAALKDTLAAMGLQPTVHIADVELTIQAEDEAIARIKSIEDRKGRAVTFDRFMEHDEIIAYLDEMAAAYPQLATIVNLGTSYEGRPLNAIKISNGPGKKAIMVDAAIHAREWLAPTVALKVVYELLENYAANQALVDMIDWYVHPVVNPDGYAYTFSNDRFWRKTRSPNSGSNCVGTDGNRNFDFHWGEEPGATPCSEVWPNTRPLSESETDALATFITNTPAITTFVTLHSYGQLLMFPYGHTTDPAPDFATMNAHANDAAAALTAVYGTEYTVGQAAVVLYYTYGTSRDWAYGGAGLPLSFTFELPPGGSGFNPPPEDILPVVTETWEAIKVLGAAAAGAVRP